MKGISDDGCLKEELVISKAKRTDVPAIPLYQSRKHAAGYVVIFSQSELRR